MEKEFVPYELAIKLKELGFDEPCFAYFNAFNKKLLLDLSNNRTGNDDERWISAPTFSQAFRWFREKYNLQHEITSQGPEYWLLTVFKTDKVTDNGIFNGKRYELDDDLDNEPKSYEEAELACLKKLIEITQKQ